MAAKLRGVAAAPGIAIAPLVHFHGGLDFIPARKIGSGDIESEKNRLHAAITSASKSIQFLRHELSSSLSAHDTKIYDAQLALLHDQTLIDDMFKQLEEDQKNVEVAVQRVVSRYEKVFEGMEDPAMREKAADFRDVGRQLLSALMAKERSVYIAGGQDYIFAADEFLPSDAGLIDREHIRGIVTARGGKYSHGAILARSLGIPSIVAVEDLLQTVQNGTRVILDGENAVLISDPDEEDVTKYERLAVEQDEAERRVFEVRFLASMTPDGTSVTLMANVEGVRDLEHIESKVISGIGLFRTEFAFMERNQFPSEEEQVKMYRKAIQWAGDKVVTFRTLDIGGDKPLTYFRTPPERNPVLGWRGLRISIDWPDFLYTQIRAILRASAGGRARIMLPMVTCVTEVQHCRQILNVISKDLEESGEEYSKDVQLGIMIEVPAISLVLDKVLPLVDFLSIGTNDMVQYLLAVDRDNPRVADLYTPYHPAMLRTLKSIAEQCVAAGKPVSICGEIAGDHHFTPILIGFGFRELSMSAVFLPRVKLMVRTYPIEECEAFAQEALRHADPEETRKMASVKAKEGWSRFMGESGRGD
ncbi:MAG: phosphoenolpyruvate--protein phosphotransferase [Planctomycetota bacterium]|jgi:phosphoenolpyruvate-protein phosphotransferase